MMTLTLLTIFALFTPTLAAAVPVPPPIFRGCNPPANLCDTMHTDCLAAGLSAERCEIISDGICPGSPCLAVSAASFDCQDEGLDCKALQKHANAGLVGCSCELKCTDTDDLDPLVVLSVCFTYPSATGEDCAEPNPATCMSLLNLEEKFCDMNVCDYVACQRAIMAQDDVCEPPPAVCAKVLECEAAEKNGG